MLKVALQVPYTCRLWQLSLHYYYSFLQTQHLLLFFCREFPLVIPGPTGTWPGLKDNAVYKLRLSVVCPSEPVESYADILVTTNSPPTVKLLKVRIKDVFPSLDMVL
jgi:hypothetical protein